MPRKKWEDELQMEISRVEANSRVIKKKYVPFYSSGNFYQMMTVIPPPYYIGP